MTGSPLQNAYQVLGVSQGATKAEITAAYRHCQVLLQENRSQPYEYVRLLSSLQLLADPAARFRLDQEIATWRAERNIKPPRPAAPRRGDNSDDPAVMYARKVSTAKGTRTRSYALAVKKYNQARAAADEAFRNRGVGYLLYDAKLHLADHEYQVKCDDIQKIYEASLTEATRLHGVPIDPIESNGLKDSA